MSRLIAFLVVFLTSCVPVLNSHTISRIHVQIAQKGSSGSMYDIGSGSILDTIGGETYVLTAKHLFKRPDEDVYFLKEDLFSKYKKIKIVALHAEFDAAVVAYNGSKEARGLSTVWKSYDININDPVVFVGAPRGYHEQIKIGSIESRCHIDRICRAKGASYIVNTPNAKGYSGGGVYINGVLVGIGTEVIVTIPFMVPIKSVFLSLEEIDSWITKSLVEK